MIAAAAQLDFFAGLIAPVGAPLLAGTRVRVHSIGDPARGAARQEQFGTIRAYYPADADGPAIYHVATDWHPGYFALILPAHVTPLPATTEELIAELLADISRLEPSEDGADRARVRDLREMLFRVRGDDKGRKGRDVRKALKNARDGVDDAD
ncbi:MAG: hypothetical protein M0006_15675 [Magnetospirillum sp.]|nr:hypothetical protein [Magnetospirillum sp.]